MGNGEESKKYVKKLETRSPFDENENITRQFRRPSLCHRIASRKKEILPSPLRCAWMSMAVFMKLSAWKRMSPLVSLDSMPTLGQGSPWKSQKVQTLNIRWTIQNVAKVTWEEGISICHWAPQTETHLTSENWRTPALSAEDYSGRLGNSGAAGKIQR